MTIETGSVSALTERVIREVERAVVGKTLLLEQIMAAILAGGHILLEDYPGLAKTLIANSFSTALGLEFNLQVLAALLVVIGYSLNDTIVIYDRIRENLELRGTTHLEDVVNQSVNQTLSRTLLTSLTTLLVVTALFGLLEVQVMPRLVTPGAVCWPPGIVDRTAPHTASSSKPSWTGTKPLAARAVRNCWATAVADRADSSPERPSSCLPGPAAKQRISSATPCSSFTTIFSISQR